jgi:hypothetical protein
MHGVLSSPSDVPWQGPTRAAWQDSVQSWIHHQVERQGLSIVGPLHCLRDRPWAIVMRVPCTGGPLFFKAVGPSGRAEPGILQALSPLFNDRLPTVMAGDSQRGWLLMADHGCTLQEHLAGADGLGAWLQLLPRFAEMQMFEQPWRALGVADRTPQVLPTLLRELLADPKVLRLGRDDGLSHEQNAQLHALLPEFDACCEALSAQAPALSHGDLYDRNVLVRDGVYRFIDFGDACVTHPLCVLLVPCQKTVRAWSSRQGRQRLELLCDAYLQAWRSHRDATALRPLLGSALWVAHVLRALTWESLGRAAQGKVRRECLRQVSSWLGILLRRRTLLRSPSF